MESEFIGKLKMWKIMSKANIRYYFWLFSASGRVCLKFWHDSLLLLNSSKTIAKYKIRWDFYSNKNWLFFKFIIINKLCQRSKDPWRKINSFTICNANI